MEHILLSQPIRSRQSGEERLFPKQLLFWGKGMFQHQELLFVYKIIFCTPMARAYCTCCTGKNGRLHCTSCTVNTVSAEYTYRPPLGHCVDGHAHTAYKVHVHIINSHASCIQTKSMKLSLLCFANQAYKVRL
jgi:hypothetical protein